MTNEEVIWNFLYNKIKNVYGTAAVMGNLMAESSFDPISANKVQKKLGLTSTAYTDAVDNGIYTNFATDGIAYGLVQWCYRTRKQGLLQLAQQENKSIGDLQLQLDYIAYELPKYKSVYKAVCEATDVKSASDIVMLKYEKPANTGEEMRRRRASYGEKYLEKYGREILEQNTIRPILIMKHKDAENLYEQLKRALK